MENSTLDGILFLEVTTEMYEDVLTEDFSYLDSLIGEDLNA